MCFFTRPSVFSNLPAITDTEDATVNNFARTLDIVFSIDMSGSTNPPGCAPCLFEIQGQFVERMIELLSPGMDTDLTGAPCPIGGQPAGA